MTVLSVSRRPRSPLRVLASAALGAALVVAGISTMTPAHAAGETDPNLSGFSISHDQTDILPLTKQAEQLNPGLKLMMTPWSAPAWMKSDDNFTSHSYLQAQYYAAYAQYFVRTIQAYQSQG